MARPRTFTEAEVLDKAVEVFWEKGYRHTSVQDLVDHLGINRASIYNAFGDKDQLFLRTLEHYQALNQVVIRELFEHENSVRAGIEKLLSAALKKNAEQHPEGCMIVNCTLELSQNNAELLNFLRNNSRIFISVMREYLSSGISRGELSAELDTTAVASYFFTFHNGLQVMSMLGLSNAEIKKNIYMALGILG